MTHTSDDASAPTLLPSELEPTSDPTTAESPLGDEANSLIGQVVADRYAVEELLGAGGMGAVYRARHVHMRKTVAVKILHQEMTCVPEVVARFEREAIAAAHIQHENVAAATDFGQLDNGSFYLVLEYVAGHSLRRELETQKTFPTSRALHVARQVTDALAAAHAAGVVHRDLKPDNVMLVERGGDPDFVKVLDFGIAKLSRTETQNAPQLTVLGSVFGTPDYMSPEQAMGTPVDHRSDLYSLGIILYEMVVGQTPFAASEPMATLTRHMTQEPPPLPPEVPEGLAATILRLLAKLPDDRHGSAHELAIELAALDECGAISHPLGPLESSPGAPPVAPPTHQWAATHDVTSPAASVVHSAHRAGASLVTLLTHPISIGSHRVPLWIPAAGALGLGFVGALSGLLLLLAFGRSPAPTVVASRGSEPASTSPPRDRIHVQPAVDRALAKRIIEQVEATPVYRRTAEEWAALGAAHHDLEQFSSSVSAYRNAISKRHALRSDPVVLSHLRRAGRDPEASQQVITVCETVLRKRNGPGLDLLFQIWVDTKADPALEDLENRYSKKLVILSGRASASLRVAIDLSNKTSCESLLAVVQRAAKHADARSLDRLTELQSRGGCGNGGHDDCYPCLRNSNALDSAIRRAKSHPAPSFQ